MTESSHNLTGVKTILSVRAHSQHLFVLDKMILTLIIILFSARSINTFYGQITIGDFTVGISSLVTFMSASTFLTTNLVNYNDSMFYINRHKSFFKIRSKFNLKSKITIDDIDLR